MDLAKFISLLNTGCLYFSRSDKLGDPFEGSIPRLVAALTKAQEEEINFRSEGKTVHSLTKQLTMIRSSLRIEMFINCWHMSRFESAAMWKLYSLSDQGIGITTSYDVLADHLPENTFFGVIRYIDFDEQFFPPSNLLYPFSHKRVSFSHEQEVRALIWASDNTPYRWPKGSEPPFGIKVPVLLNEVIKEVYVHPDSPGWFFELVKDVCKRYGLSVPVNRSTIGASPNF